MGMETSSGWNSTLDTKQSKSEVLKLVDDLKSAQFARALLDAGKYALAYGPLYLFLPISEGKGERPANIDFFSGRGIFFQLNTYFGNSRLLEMSVGEWLLITGASPSSYSARCSPQHSLNFLKLR
jgi:hypothetical protein